MNDNTNNNNHKLMQIQVINCLNLLRAYWFYSSQLSGLPGCKNDGMSPTILLAIFSNISFKYRIVRIFAKLEWLVHWFMQAPAESH